MTPDERQRVNRLARALYPTEIERHDEDRCDPHCKDCDYLINEWNDRLWLVYNALIEAELSI